MADLSYESVLLERSGVVELRAFDVGGDKNVCGRFDKPDELKRAARRLSGNCFGVYTTLNQISDKALSSEFSVSNDFAAGVPGVRDEHMVRRVWLPFDFDSTSRPKDLAASEEELEQSKDVAVYVKTELTGRGWPEPVLGMSGNGHHLLYAVDLPCDEDTNYMVKRLYYHLAYHVKRTVAPTLSADIKFDSVCHNPSRIWKLYGTLTQKGDPTDERPHREAKCAVPADLIVVDTALLENYAGAPGAEQLWLEGIREKKAKSGGFESHDDDRPKHSPGKGDYSTCDVEQLFQDKGLYRFPIRGTPGKHSVFCPWSDHHSSPQDSKGTDSVVWEPDPAQGEERQWPIFHCSHEHCSETGPEGKRTFDSLRKLWGNKEIDGYCSKKYEAPNPFDAIQGMAGLSAPHSAPSPNRKKQGKRTERDAPSDPPEPDRPKDPPPPTGQVAEPTEQAKKVQEEVRARTKSRPPLITLGAPKKEEADIVQLEIEYEEEPLGDRWAKLCRARHLLATGIERWSHPDSPDPLATELVPVDHKPASPSRKQSTKKIARLESERTGDSHEEEAAPATEQSSAKSSAPPDPDADANLGIGGDGDNNLEHIQTNLIAILGTKLTYHIGKDEVMTQDSVRHTFPKFGNEWLKSKGRRAVWKPNFIFDPTKPRFDPKMPWLVNRFRGFSPPSGPSCDPAILLKHFLYLFGSEKKAFEYAMKWFALPLQRLGTKMESAIILKGAHGTGKNIVLTRICNDIYGHYGTTITATQLSSQYNEWAQGKLFILANEVTTRREKKDVQNKLKAMISDEDIMINAKFKDTIPQKNFANYVFLSNETNPITIEEGDRRYLVGESLKAKSGVYYEELGEAIRAGALVGLYEYWMDMDLTGFSRHSKPPMTKSKADSIADRLPPHDRFFDCLLKNDVEMPHENLMHTGCFEKQSLWDAFNIWKKHNGYKSDWCTSPVFFHKADRVLGERRQLNVYVEKKDGARKRTKRTYYVIDDDDSDNVLQAQEIHYNSEHFAKQVAANDVTSSNIAVLHTTEDVVSSKSLMKGARGKRTNKEKDDKSSKDDDEPAPDAVGS